jgi:Holliday junction resolvase RusA-like endonuclease
VGVIRFTVPLVTPSLKNSNGMNRRGQRFDNPQVKAYKRDFPALVPPQYRNLRLGGRSALLRLSVTLYHDSWRRDADIEIIKDCLQAAGVIQNDRWIRESHTYATEIDPDNPRCEITLEDL